MDTENVKPELVTKPFQLLAAALVVVVVITGSLLGTACAFRGHDWIAAFLSISAVSVILVFLCLIFILLVKFREVLLADSLYIKNLDDERRAALLASRLGHILEQEDLNVMHIVLGRSVENLTADLRESVKSLTAELANTITRLERSRGWDGGLHPTVMVEVARGLLAEGRWLDAAKRFDEYVAVCGDDWEAQFSRGVAHANARIGTASDLEALRAYSEAVALAPIDVNPDIRARLFTYRAAMLKRLHRYDEAENDLSLAMKFTENATLLTDVYYNMAAVYSMRREKDKMLGMLKKILPKPGWKERLRQKPYFKHYLTDPEFAELIE